MVAAATIAAATIAAGASAYSSSQASKAQRSAANNATSVQQGMYDQTRNDLQPYRDLGSGFASQLGNLSSGNPATVQSQLEALPGYQFTRKQGLQAVQSGAAARGLGTSGAALRGAADYTTGLANSTYGDQFNRLLAGTQIGQNAAAQTGNFGIQTGQSIGNNLLGAGNASAAASIATGNAIGNGVNSVGQLYLLNALSKSNGGSGLFGSPSQQGGYSISSPNWTTNGP